VIRQNHIYNNKCDGITFVSYGVAEKNTIYQNGWDCENGPIPGASIYSLKNKDGGRLIGNKMYNTCGHVIDIDRGDHFHIEGNHAYDPGYRWGGKYNYCAGSAIFLLDVRQFKIIGNTFENKGRNWNNGFDPNAVTRAVGAAAFSDLPFGSKTAIAFVLAKRPNSSDTTTSNTIENNKMRAYCSGGGCGGLGYFTSRGTGHKGTAWSASTTNYFRGNDPFGSQVGSVRCGGNWYAGNSTCGQGAKPPCNSDDYQHNPPKGDNFRNDKCNFYR